jgi:hypothetical protein
MAGSKHCPYFVASSEKMIILSYLVFGVRRSFEVRRSSMGCGVAQWLACWTVEVQSRVRFSPSDCWFPVLGSILTQSPPLRAAQEQELPLSEVGPNPGWQPGWILYYKIYIKSRKKYLGFHLCLDVMIDFIIWLHGWYCSGSVVYYTRAKDRLTTAPWEFQVRGFPPGNTSRISSGVVSRVTASTI